MDVTIERDALLRGLAAVEYGVVRSPSLPILGYVLLKAHPDGLEITATNLELAISAHSEAKTKLAGAVAVPFKTLAGLTQNITSSPLRLTQKPPSALEFQAGAQKAKLQTSPLDDFPQIPEVKEKTAVVCEHGPAFVQQLEQVLPAVAVSDVRPELSGVLCEASEDGVVLVATDTFRLALRSAARTKINEPKVFILPKKTAEAVVRLFRESKTIDIRATATQVFFTDGARHLTSRLIEGSFPDFAAILPKTEVATIRLSREELMQQLHAASLFTSRLQDVHISLQPKTNTITVAATNPDVGEYETELKGVAEGQAITLAFNFRYVLDGLNGFPGLKQIELVFVGEGRPLVLRPPDEAQAPQQLYLVMPIRTNV